MSSYYSSKAPVHEAIIPIYPCKMQPVISSDFDNITNICTLTLNDGNGLGTSSQYNSVRRGSSIYSWETLNPIEIYEYNMGHGSARRSFIQIKKFTEPVHPDVEILNMTLSLNFSGPTANITQFVQPTIFDPLYYYDAIYAGNIVGQTSSAPIELDQSIKDLYKNTLLEPTNINPLGFGFISTTQNTTTYISNIEMSVQYKLPDFHFLGNTDTNYIDVRGPKELEDRIIAGESTIHIFKNNFKITDLQVNVESDINWSNITFDNDLNQYKSLAHFPEGISNLPGKSGENPNSFALYVPKLSEHNMLHICPEADTLQEISLNCAVGYSIDLDSPSVSLVDFQGEIYWKVENLTGTGALSYTSQSTELTNTNINTLTNTGNSILVVSLTSILFFIVIYFYNQNKYSIITPTAITSRLKK